MDNDEVITATTTLQVLECGGCGIVYALPVAFQIELQNTHATFYCPRGCSRHFPSKSNVERLRDALAKEEDQRGHVEAELTREIQGHKTTRHQLRATKGVVTRTKRRISHGVCPCCKRIFQNLKAHMTNQHPDYGAE